MVSKQVIEINEDKCIGCGKCVNACHNSALALVDGKARLVGEIQCDGLGACIGDCPVDALKIVQRKTEPVKDTLPCGCPGVLEKKITRTESVRKADSQISDSQSALTNWPIQLKLINTSAPFFQQADIVIAADCTAFSFGAFHAELLEGKSLIIACPKLDDQQLYIDKLSDLICESQPKSLTVVRMEVPCCSGLTQILKQAREKANSTITINETVISVEGKIVNEKSI